MMDFAYPMALALLAALPVWYLWYRRREKQKKSAVRFPAVRTAAGIPPGGAVKMRHLPFAIRLAAAALIILAIARPQTGHGYREITRHGIDIMLALDISTSMDVADVKPSRLKAAKKAIMDFIGNRRNDRIGLILFSGTSFTRCPLTLDYQVLRTFLEPVKSGMVEDGTAIGMAIANGVNRLKDSDADTKIMVLLTDGVNNRGLIDPRSAVQLAKAEGIRVYTIGLGREGVFNVEVDDPRFGTRKVPVQSEIDTELLKEIAQKTGGRYYAARNEKELGGIYDAIDKLEKSEIKSRMYYNYTEEFAPLVWGALFLLLAEWALTNRLMRRNP